MCKLAQKKLRVTLMVHFQGDDGSPVAHLGPLGGPALVLQKSKQDLFLDLTPFDLY